jgi:hypothetical protein
VQHQTGERQECQPSHGCGQAFIGACQAAEARQPGATALDPPAARQQHEAARGSFGRGQRDHCHLDAVRRGGLRRRVAGGALVDVGLGQRHRLAGHGLHQRRQLGDLCALLFVGRGTHPRQYSPSPVLTLASTHPRQYSPSPAAGPAGRPPDGLCVRCGAYAHRSPLPRRSQASPARYVRPG